MRLISRKHSKFLLMFSATLLLSLSYFIVCLTTSLSYLHILIKQKGPSLPRNLPLSTFGELLIMFSTKVNLFNSQEVLSSASDESKLFAKTFKNSNLDDSGISLPVFLSRTNLELHNVSVTPKMVKKVVTNLDSYRRLVLIVFQWWI